MRIGSKLVLACVIALFPQHVPTLQKPQLTLTGSIQRSSFLSPNSGAAQDSVLVPPIMLKRESLQAGNPLATYAAMLEREPSYLKSKIFEDFYRQTR
ncbi:MAG: hypothetical protein HY088_04445, partial [Ignavibacteriales bacterium]|nr:hypothetical protein [Ignavibacteriales bacterium]